MKEARREIRAQMNSWKERGGKRAGKRDALDVTAVDSVEYGIVAGGLFHHIDKSRCGCSLLLSSRCQTDKLPHDTILPTWSLRFHSPSFSLVYFSCMSAHVLVLVFINN